MLLKNSYRIALVCFLALLVGCFSGGEKTVVGNTGYYFINLDGYQRFLVNDESEIVISPAIVDFVKQGDSYVFVRQIVKELTCDSGTLRTEITGNFEYWSLYKENEYKLAGPFQEVELQARLVEKYLSKEGWLKLASKLKFIKENKAFFPSGNACD
ncbi:MAG: hypothetical protein P8Y42_23125 [Exilibacterium sp.]